MAHHLWEHRAQKKEQYPNIVDPGKVERQMVTDSTDWRKVNPQPGQGRAREWPASTPAGESFCSPVALCTLKGDDSSSCDRLC